MTTKDYIKLSLIAAGYVKNIQIEINQHGIDTEYSVYGETWDYEEPDGDFIDTEAVCNLKGDVISMEYENSLLWVLTEIHSKQKDCKLKFFYRLLDLSIKDLLNDELRENIIRAEDERQIKTEEHCRKMKPVWEYVDSINPCNKAPDCGGDFDDSDTCHGFWKCTHQYHNNCDLRYKAFRDLAHSLESAYKKYAYNQELTEEETNLLKEHKLS